MRGMGGPHCTILYHLIQHNSGASVMSILFSVIIRHICLIVVDLRNYIYLASEWILIDCAHHQFLFCDTPIFCAISDVPYILIYFWCTILLYLLWCTNIMCRPWFTLYLSLLLMYPIIAFTLMYLIFALFSDTPNIWFIYSDVPHIRIFSDIPKYCRIFSDVPNICIRLWYTKTLLYIFWCT